MHACLYPQEGELCSYDTQSGRKAGTKACAVLSSPCLQTPRCRVWPDQGRLPGRLQVTWGRMGRVRARLGEPFLELICPGLATLLL